VNYSESENQNLNITRECVILCWVIKSLPNQDSDATVVCVSLIETPFGGRRAQFQSLVTNETS